jgi:hypothetical protein
MGHHVKLVSATNGDIGHWQIAGGPLAQRRRKEVMEVGRRLGVTLGHGRRWRGQRRHAYCRPVL